MSASEIESVGSLAEFVSFTEECRRSKVDCPFSGSDPRETRRALGIADVAIAHAAGDMPADEKALADGIDMAGIRTCLNAAGVSIPQKNMINTEVQIDNS